MAWPSGTYLASFSGCVHLFQASMPAAPPLSHVLHPCPLRDTLSKGLSSGPKELLGGCMSVNPGLWHGTSPSASTMQVKGLWAYTMLPKSDASSQESRALNQDEIYNNGWPKWRRKNWRCCGHRSTMRTYWMTLMVRGSLQNGLFVGFGCFPSASLGTQLVKLYGVPL